MPQIFQNSGKVAVTYEELVPEHYPTYNALKVALYRSEKRGYGVQRLMRGGNERQLLVDLDTLPRRIRECFKDPRVSEHPLEQFYSVDAEASDFYSNYKYNGVYLSDDLQEKYITNASVLLAATSLKDARERERLSKMGTLKGLMRSIHYDVTSFNDVLQKRWGVRHSLPENERRFLDKFNEFQREGYPCLINKNLGNRNAAVATDEIITLLNSIFAYDAHKPTITEVHRQYEAFLSGYIEVINPQSGEIYCPSNFKKLSKSTVYNYIEQWKNRLATHAVRSGDRQKLMSKYKPYHSLEQPKLSGSIISIDDRQPPFEYEKGKRMWFYNGIDLASEAFVCWVYGKTKEGIILDFYRQLVRNFYEWGLNPPAELEAESSLNSSFKNTFLREGAMFQYVRIEANNARGKRIEAYYRQLRYDVEKSSDGWLARPFAIRESNQQGSADVPLIPYQRLAEERLLDIERWNNMPHSKFPEKTRWEYFLENQNPNLRPPNYKTFIKDLGYRTETSCNLGIVKFQNGEYLLGEGGAVCTGERLIELMNQVEGKPVEVYWLDDNYGEVFTAFIYQGDRLICEAVRKPRYNRARIEQTPQDAENREIMSKYVATIEGYRKSQRQTLERLHIVRGEEQPQPKKVFRINGAKPLDADPINSEMGSEFESVNGVEILPEAPDDDTDFINIEKPFNRSLKDRF